MSRKTVLLIAIAALLLGGASLLVALDGPKEGRKYSTTPLGESGSVVIASSRRFSAVEQDVIDRLVTFADATAAGRHAVICARLFSRALVNQYGGVDCKRNLPRNRASFEGFKVEVTGIDLSDNDQVASIDALTRTARRPMPREEVFLMSLGVDRQWHIGLSKAPVAGATR